MFQWYENFKRRWRGEQPAPDQAPATSHTSISWYACVNGLYCPIEQVPDPTFAKKMVGDGVAIQPSLSQQPIVAPTAGKITKIFETLHAFSMKSEQGLELFVHVGIDSVKLQGEGFKRVAEVGADVQAGTPILVANFEQLNRKLKSLATIIVVSNLKADQTLSPSLKANDPVTAGQTIISKIELKRA